MQNNSSNNYLQEDEIDLKELFKLLINSKKLIITITLVITTLGAIYGFQKAPEYKSTAIIVIGHYESNSFSDALWETKLIESTTSLIQNLNINFIHKLEALGINSDNFAFKPIEDRLIQITYTSPSSVTSDKKVNEILAYIKNRHSLLTQKTKNHLTYKIKSLENQVGTLIENGKTRIANEIIILEIFALSKEKDRLELELEFLMKQNLTKTQKVGEILTDDVSTKKEVIILLSFIFGLFLSIIIVLINNSLKAFKEE
jgi:capsular polysaccharide biosynthesis protein